MAKRKVKLTRKRADWVGGRKVTLRGEPMRVNESSANKLAESAMSQVYKMHLDVNKQVMALFDTELAKQSVPKNLDKITTEDVAQDASENNGYASLKLDIGVARKIHKKLTNAGISDLINPEKMHLTLMYSASNNILTSPKPEKEYRAEFTGEPLIMGNNPWRALVIKVKSSEISVRHKELKIFGGVHSHPDFKPHLSLKYSPTEKDLELIKSLSIDGGLIFSNESFEPVKKTSSATDGFAMDASISVKARHLMNKLIRKWEKHFNLYADNFADSMIKTVTKQSSADLKKAGEKLSGGMTIKTDTLSQRTKDIIYASTDESSSLIKTLASNYTTSVKEAVSRSIASNTSSLTQLREEIHAGLQDKYKVQRNKAKNVALDQARKAYSNIGASKMQDAGLDQYIWRHSGGSQNPRSYHKNTLAGKTFSLSDPPVIDLKTGEKGKPGDAINCKCFMEPVISFG